MIVIAYPNGHDIEITNGNRYEIDKESISIYDVNNELVATFYKMDGMGVIDIEKETEG